jgi:transposase
MLQMFKSTYEPEFKEMVIRLHLEEGRTIGSITKEYHLGKGTLRYWLRQRRKECQLNPVIKEENKTYEEMNRLHKELTEVRKENEFLKKAAAFFAKEID